MKRTFTIAIAAAVCLGAACHAAESGSDLDTLVAWMEGSFSSAQQAKTDTSYFDIRLEMVRIWAERSDGHWLYVEQAAASTLERPYRQRVYRVSERPAGVFSSEVYEIPDPLRFAGAWREDRPLQNLTPDSLSLKKGCAVLLRIDSDGMYAGSTEGTACKSTLRGASYATSEVTVGQDRMVSWDRGFDDQGTQVWGATEGPYVFRRVDHR